jgi:hypothetical protein
VRGRGVGAGGGRGQMVEEGRGRQRKAIKERQLPPLLRTRNRKEIFPGRRCFTNASLDPSR